MHASSHAEMPHITAFLKSPEPLGHHLAGMLMQHLSHPRSGVVSQKVPTTMFGVGLFQAWGHLIKHALFHGAEVLVEPTVDAPSHDQEQGKDRKGGSAQN